MSSTLDDEGIERHYGLFRGTVIDDKDPLMLGRVVVEVPGILEPGGDLQPTEKLWAWPLGMPGGGAAQRGMFDPPKAGSAVGVLFEQGDPEHPHYLCGNWGQTKDGTEVPTYVKENAETAEDATKIKVWEDDRFQIVKDTRDGKQALIIQDKVSEDRIEIDGASPNGQGIIIKATAGIVLETDGMVEIRGGCGVQINGRAVAPTAKVL